MEDFYAKTNLPGLSVLLYNRLQVNVKDHLAISRFGPIFKSSPRVLATQNEIND